MWGAKKRRNHPKFGKQSEIFEMSSLEQEKILTPLRDAVKEQVSFVMHVGLSSGLVAKSSVTVVLDNY